jgi:hypothetical protein
VTDLWIHGDPLNAGHPARVGVSPRGSIVKASGRIKLPRHVYWSGEDPQGKQWELDDPRQRELVYRMVMIEGTDDDVRRFIDVDELVTMWSNLVLPKRVRAAWEAWLRQRGDTRP